MDLPKRKLRKLSPDKLAKFPDDFQRNFILGNCEGIDGWTIDNDFELWHWVRCVINMEIPRERVCEEHVAPFKAFADAYFCRDNYMIWKACVPGDAMVATTSGPVPMKNVEAGMEVWGYDGERITTGTVRNKYDNGEDEILKVQTRSGSFRVTHDHRVFVRRKEPDPEGGRGNPVHWPGRWVEAQNIQEGDFVIHLHDPSYKGGGVLPTDLAEVIGLIVGDGFVSTDRKYKVGIAHDPKANYIQHYLDVIQSYFDTNYRTVPDNRVTWINSKEFTRFIDDLGIGYGAHNKRIPDVIWSSSKAAQLGFLRGYLDADGTIREDSEVKYWSVNRRLMEDVLQLTHQLGLNPGAIRKREHSREVEINGRMVERDDIYTISVYSAASHIGTHDDKYDWTDPDPKQSTRSERNRWRAPVEEIDGTKSRKVLNVTEEDPQRVWDLEVSGTNNFFADSYLVHNSRGFGGKSAMLATLCLTEAISLGASITILGGSGEQSHRVREYLKGDHDNFPDHYWESPVLQHWQGELWESAPTKGRTSLANSGRTTALMASQTSVRGPHPQRLRGDEIDEMDQSIWNAAKGQPMENRGIEEQIVGSSTHQNPDGTMTHEIDEAKKKGLPVHQWCYRETMNTNKGGWLSPAQVERKKEQVPIKVWEHEYELQEPSPENRAIDQDIIESTFVHTIDGTEYEPIQGHLGTRHIFEEPIEITEDMEREDEPQYGVGADWGKNMDRTIITVMRCDVKPIRLVAFAHLARQPWPMMIGRYEDFVEMYNDAAAAHDATGLGDVIHDHLTIMAEGVKMQGAERQSLLSEYMMALENNEIRIPKIEYMEREHKTMTSDDLTGRGHPPDTFVSGALSYRACIYGWQELLF